MSRGGGLGSSETVSLIVYNPVGSEIHYADQAGFVSAFASVLGLKAHDIVTGIEVYSFVFNSKSMKN